MTQRIHVTSSAEAEPFQIRMSSQRWPRAGVKAVYTIRCSECGQRHRLSFSWYWLEPGKSQSQRLLWGAACHRTQFTFEDDALPRSEGSNADH